MRTLRLVILICFTLFTLLTQGQSLKFDWVKTMPVVSNYGSLMIRDTDTDSNGDFYSIFRTQGTIDTDPSQDTSAIITVGSTDLIIQKADTSGNLIWAKHFPGLSNWSVSGLNIKCDQLGNIIVIGNFTDSVDFNPDTNSFFMIGHSDIFVVKLDTAGNFVWANRTGGLSSNWPSGLNTDNAGNIYVTGTFYDSIDLDPSPGILMKYSNGTKDFFIQKLTPNGNLIWAQSYGGNGNDFCSTVAIDPQSDIILTGSYSGTTYFDATDSTQVLTGTQSRNLFILKLDSSGGFIWTKGTPPSNNIIGNDISLDAIGNIFISGIFDEQANFDTIPSSSLYTGERMDFDVYDAYLLKLRSNGDFVWVKGFQGYGANDISSPIFTTNNQMTLAGHFTYKIDVDPSPTNYVFTGDWQTNMYVEKLDSLGNFIWASPFFSSILCVGKPISLTSTNELFIGGSYNGMVDFDPGMDTLNYTSQNGTNAFYLKLKPCYTPSPMTTLSITSCNSYTWSNGKTYTSSTNQARQTFSNITGCDSIVTLDLTILPFGISYDNVFICDSVNWIDGNTYYQTNDSAAIITIPNGSSNGCDSLVILNLVNESNTSTISVYECNSYTWENGITYYSSTNAPTMIYTNNNGCDSVVTLDLKLKPYDTSIVTNGLLITAEYTQGLRYQWYNCDTDSIIPGATFRTFLANNNGHYAVIYSRPNRCTDTSSCFWLAPVGIENDNNLYKDIDFYPNPTKDFISIEFPNYLKSDVEILVVNLSGQIIHQEKVSKQNNPWITQIDLSTLHSGLYILKVIVNENEYNFKLSKY